MKGKNAGEENMCDEKKRRKKILDEIADVDEESDIPISEKKVKEKKIKFIK